PTTSSSIQNKPPLVGANQARPRSSTYTGPTGDGGSPWAVENEVNAGSRHRSIPRSDPTQILPSRSSNTDDTSRAGETLGAEWLARPRSSTRTSPPDPAATQRLPARSRIISSA